jgi:peroxiredoxin
VSIQIGDKMPETKLGYLNDDGMQMPTTTEYFAGSKVALFAVPGAYTPTCSAAHLPGYVVHGDALKAKGIDKIACVSVNDAFVMQAWGQVSNAEGQIDMLSDGNGELAVALGLEMDGSGFLMGQRSQRFSMVVDDGVVTQLNVEAPGEFKVSAAEYMLEQL